MRDLFPGFYEPTEQEIAKMWQEGIFVFDTNMLLHIYRYSPDTRERFFETLSRLQERIWIPYQVAYEYQDRRVAVISEQIKAYDEVAKLLDTALQKLKSGLEAFKTRHAFIDPVKLTEEITRAISEAKSSVLKAKSEHPKYKENDPLRERIDELFNSRVGKPYPKDKLEEKYQEAELRFQRQIPPGLEDAGKSGKKKYGDVILWFQLIDYARSEQKPIILITDDEKRDWWLTGEESRGPIRPRPELVQEIYAEANVPFYMYQGYKFMQQAQKFLKLEEKPEVIEEIKEVSQKEELNEVTAYTYIPRAFGGTLLFQKEELNEATAYALLGRFQDIVIHSIDPINLDTLTQEEWNLIRGSGSLVGNAEVYGAWLVTWAPIRYANAPDPWQVMVVKSISPNTGTPAFMTVPARGKIPFYDEM